MLNVVGRFPTEAALQSVTMRRSVGTAHEDGGFKKSIIVSIPLMPLSVAGCGRLLGVPHRATSVDYCM